MLIQIFALLGTVLAAIAAVWPLLLGFFPRLGVHHFYRLQRRRNLLAVAGVLTGLVTAHRIERRLPVAVTLIFGALSQILKPERIFVSLDTPATVPADNATLADEELIIGMEVNGVARAWPLRKMVVPHHLINDYIGGSPILVGY